MIDVALIGAGKMGALHARTVWAHPEVRLRRVFDVDGEKSETLAAAYGAGIGLPETEPLVIIATPASAHVRSALPLLGKAWLLVEKPLAPTAEEARVLLHPRVLCGHSDRFAWEISQRPHTARRIMTSRAVAPSARGRDVDVISDLLVHDIDRLLLLVDAEVKVVRATGQRGEDGDLDEVRAELAWPGGKAVLSASRISGAAHRTFEVDGERPEPNLSPDALTRQLTAVLQRMRGQTSRACQGAEAIAVLEICDAIRGAVAR